MELSKLVKQFHKELKKSSDRLDDIHIDLIKKYGLKDLDVPIIEEEAKEIFDLVSGISLACEFIRDNYEFANKFLEFENKFQYEALKIIEPKAEG